MQPSLRFALLLGALSTASACAAQTPPPALPAPPSGVSPAPDSAPPSVDALLARCTRILAYGETFSSGPPTKSEAVTTLGLLGDPRAVPVLADHLRNSENPLLRRQVVRALSWIGGDAAIAALEETLRDRDPDLRPLAAAALRTLTGREHPYDRTGVTSRQQLIDELRARRAESK